MFKKIIIRVQNSKLESRFPQMFHDHSDLLCQQIFCLFAVTGLVEVVHQRFTLVDPSHQVVHRYLGFAVRKIEHGQFGLTVTFYLKHNGWVFIVFVFSHRCFLIQISTSHVLKHTDFYLFLACFLSTRISQILRIFAFGTLNTRFF